MKKGRRKFTREVPAEGPENSGNTSGKTVFAGIVGTVSGIGRRFREVFPTEDSTSSKGIKGVFTRLFSMAAQNKAILLRIVLPMLYCIIFGGTKFEMGIYPFGISAICAAVSGGPALIAAASAAVSSLFVRGGFYIAITSAVIAGILFLIRRFRNAAADGVVFRAALSLTAGAGQALLFSISDGITFYELCSIFLSATLCPVLTVALRGMFTSSGSMTPAAEAGIYAILYTGTYFLRTLSPVGASAATMLSMTGALFASYAFGISRGIITGVTFGLAAPPEFSLIYAVAAAGSGVLMGISPMAAVTAGVLLAMSFGVYSGGASAFGELFPEFMFCVAIVGPLFHYKVIPVLGKKNPDLIASQERAIISEARTKLSKRKLTALSDSLGAISSVMARLARVFSRPSVIELRQMCDEAFDESCQNCRSRIECWDREYRSTSGAISEMASAIRRGGKVDRSYLPDGMSSRCMFSDMILNRINIGAGLAARTAAVSDSTAVYADDYAAMSRLLREVADDEEDFVYDKKASAELAGRLSGIGLHSTEVSVYGKRRRRVFVRGLELGCSAGGEELRTAASSVLGCTMSSPEYRLEGRNVMMSMHTAPKYALTAGRCSVAKRGEKCGDSITTFKGEGGYFYALISDGMGSGGDAAVTSNLSAMFLERMLGAGCSLTSAMEMLNSFLSRRNMECFTTVDLMEADLITGELKFVKSGAAPSFILRGGRLFKLSSRTVPVGIVTPFDAEQLRFSAKAGDFVVMLSDGAASEDEDCPWLYDMLCGTETKPFLTSGCDLTAAAKEIAKRAAKESDFGDDVTVGIIAIKDV